MFIKRETLCVKLHTEYKSSFTFIVKKFLSLEIFTLTPWLTWLTNMRYVSRDAWYLKVAQLRSQWWVRLPQLDVFLLKSRPPLHNHSCHFIVNFTLHLWKAVRLMHHWSKAASQPLVLTLRLCDIACQTISCIGNFLCTQPRNKRTPTSEYEALKWRHS